MTAMLQSLPMIAVTVLAFGLLIVIHEAGHYLAARWSGMRVERFSIGFGPVIWSRKRGDTEWAVSAIPLGGYVKIAGMAPGEDIPEGDTSAYSGKPAWKRFLVILAGPAMNYLLAIVLAVGLIATMGLREPDQSSVIGDVIAGGAAERAGLRAGDRVLSAGGAAVDDWKSLVQAVRSHPGQDLPLTVARAGATPGSPPETLALRPDDAGGIGKAGIAPNLRAVRAGLLEAVAQGVRRTNDKAGEILGGLGQVVTRKQKAELQGPLGIAQEMTRSARAGAAPFLMMVWLISIMLAIFNFLPLPALDGGRLIFLAYEMVFRRPVNQRVEAVIHTVGFVLLFGLLIGVTLFGDLPRLFPAVSAPPDYHLPVPITVLYFAVAREAAGADSESLAGAPGSVGALRDFLAGRHPALARVLPRCRLAVNQEFVGDDDPVPEGAEVAVIPPVSGGSGRFRVVDRPLELAEAIDAVAGPERGGLVTFRGDVRGTSHGKRVLRLEYEAYVPMAERKLAEIGQAIGDEHGALLSIVHRVGSLSPGEAAVVIAAAAPHRAPAFRACEAAIERLKKDAPIWKREVYEDGSEWVGMGP